MKEIVGLVAVRMESTRLPGKPFKLLNGIPLLQVLIDRLASTPYLDDFIVCTTTRGSDDKIEKFCQERGVKVYRGEVENVLGRFVGASRSLPSEYVVRITGDNPLSDFPSMHRCFEYLKEKGAGYSRPVGVPYGTACEVIKTDVLYELNEKTLSYNLSEYMTYFFERMPSIKIALYQVDWDCYFPELRLTVDYEADLAFLEKIVGHFGGIIPPLVDIVTYCRTLDDYPRHCADQNLADKIKGQIRFKP